MPLKECRGCEKCCREVHRVCGRKHCREECYHKVHRDRENCTAMNIKVARGDVSNVKLVRGPAEGLHFQNCHSLEL